jgi:hypothetical protein
MVAYARLDCMQQATAMAHLGHLVAPGGEQPAGLAMRTVQRRTWRSLNHAGQSRTHMVGRSLCPRLHSPTACGVLGSLIHAQLVKQRVHMIQKLVCVMQRRLQQTVPRAVPPAGINEATYFVRKNIRSGTAVNYPQGNVVVLGDVNPGSAVIAGGDIFVWGRCVQVHPCCSGHCRQRAAVAISVADTAHPRVLCLTLPQTVLKV